LSQFIQLTSAADPVEAGFLRGLLESAGLEVQVRSDMLWSVAVEIYYSDGARPSIWVRRKDLLRARGILASRHEKSGSSWVCGHCSESLEGQFTACWNCGRQRRCAS